jgi:ABC-type multidrug transport system ATPase subunit
VAKKSGNKTNKMNEIEINSLCKTYGKITALDNLNLSIAKNDFYGIIGPDGAGKTTLLRIIASLLIPDSGSVFVAGLDSVKDYKKLRMKLGYMPGRFSLYHDLTVLENLNFFASVFGTTIEENYHLIKDIYSQIEPFKNRRAGKLSGGMKQKLALSCALIHKPDILILDEPTTGVDAVSRREFWEMLDQIRKQGLTIIVSTPYMEEANLCDKISLIFDGKIVDSGTPDDIRSRFTNLIFTVKTNDVPGALKILRQFEEIKSVNSFGHNLHVVAKNEKMRKHDIEDFLISNQFQDFVVEHTSAGIEDCFINHILETKSKA